MSDQRTVKRLVVLIDGSELKENKKEVTQSNIQRLKQLVREGTCPSSHSVVQTTKYHVVVGTASKFSDRFRSKTNAGDNTADLIRNIVKEACHTLEHPEDELWLFGSGHGAFVALAVAGIVHHMGLPKPEFAYDIDELFDSTCALVKAQLEDDYRRGPQLMQSIKSQTNPGPVIPFVGLFDTMKPTSSKAYYDTSFTSSIRTLRHALAINENRSSHTPEILEFPNQADLASQSFIQAWFLGTSDDLCGGQSNDGLSLYPLQWILLESIRAGLSLVSKEKSTTSDNPMSLAFPQYAGNLPNLDGSEDIEWRLRYSNGLQVSMFDLQATHVTRSATGSNIYSLKFDPERYRRKANRKIFSSEGDLKGWSERGQGTIIHPSLFCVLDRYPRHLDLPNFQPIKTKLSRFQDNCFNDDEDSLAPWLRDMQLQASGVKAFRILVCGKTGVGKSTLINRVFGVEMTSESDSYDQGVHDINVAFESPKHPGLLIHDSRGWQAGSDTELDLIAKFLRYRAFQQDPAEALHVIWFCVDSDVSRIEEADKRTFATIAEFSHDVPVFVVGTKKDKLTGYRKMQLVEELMEKTNDFKEAKKLAEEQANKMADDQFAELRNQLSQIEHYKADGYCCLSKDSDEGVKDLLSQTLGLIADDRVRLFCVAAQVVDVEQKINSAITECMRLGTHAIRTAAVPLPFSGIIGTPTVSRLICEHVLQCFGFPKATPAEVEKIMKDIVMGNLKKFMAVSLTQFVTVSAIAIGVAIPTAGIGAVLGAAGCIWGMPITARMLLKCSCDMILILERSFRYDGKYVSVKQIEDAAKYYTTTVIKTFSGKEKRLQQQVHDEIDQLIPLKKVSVGFKFNKLRGSVEEIIYSNRFGKPPDYESIRSTSSLALDKYNSQPKELSGAHGVSELPGDVDFLKETGVPLRPAELESGEVVNASPTTVTSTPTSGFGSLTEPTVTRTTVMTGDSQKGTSKLAELPVPPPELEGDTLIGGPREELEGSMPAKSKTEGVSRSRWKPSSWKFGTKKTKTK
ncbi:hypothetical protein B0T10DRAFT_438346 [Thelonectria olida]|uniref:G domain-containing protein n=1 Tax=Thelonectria olida TaxID=1576542 RepID=A0A9P8WAE6_9HYPO|nr:hypothetical protein B0T10DRAFT_438346 [Thelonectria olida]